MRKVRLVGQQIGLGWRIYSTVFTRFFVFLCLLILEPGIAPDIYADEIKPGDEVTIITPGTEARLCPHLGCGPDRHITRIPEGTVLTVKSTEDFVIGTFKVKWFEVVYEENRGWISIYDTDKARK
jgi:hypothetical protein